MSSTGETNDVIDLSQSEPEYDRQPETPSGSKGNDLKPIDRLTEMPDDILSCILSFLTIRDSVKARILSRRWRYICPCMLNLDFDLHTVLGINHKARYSNGDSDMSWEDKSKFVTGVDQFLELYNGQKLDSLRICFCLGNEYAGYVNRWIRFAIIMKTEKLDLDFSTSPESQSNNLYDFPCQLLPQGDSSQLKYLCLKSCNLGPTPNLVSRLISLKSLDLEHVPLNQSCANSILSSCLNLEWLRLKNSILPETLCIHGPSLHLKILIVHECYGVEKFEISSIGLTTFEYIGKVKNFSFLDVPRLEKVHIRFMVAYERGTQYMFNGIANDLPRLQTLSLVLTTDEVLPISARITRFNSLKQLELFVMKFLKQILCGISYCHSNGVLHRDLKPDNLLIDTRSNTLKIADFGHARGFVSPDLMLTPKLVTLGYRAPEILMSSKHYSAAVDMWSVGCIFAEMVMTEPLFNGQSEIDVLQEIFSLLGTPNEDSWPGVTSLPGFPHDMIQSPPMDLGAVLKDLEPAGLDLLSGLLSLDPERRTTAEAALGHEFLSTTTADLVDAFGAPNFALA